MEVFEQIKVIGKGSYGEVWLSKHKKDKKQYVLKRINLQRASCRDRTSAHQEAKLLQKLKHPNIVSYKESFETPNGMLYIAMQYCEGGDLYTRLKERKGKLLEERQVVEWFVQIAMALQYMHERNILHRDLKTQNIFLTKNKIIKVGDLGIARVLESSTDMATTLIGTPYYMSPELFSNKPYNQKSDVWALGCCVYEMTTLKHAFNAKDMNSLVYKILRKKLPPMPSQYSPELIGLMRGMLQQDAEKRPSVNKLLKDAYIRQCIAVFLEDTKKSLRPASKAAAKLLQPGSCSNSASSSVVSNKHYASESAKEPNSNVSSASEGHDSRLSNVPSRHQLPAQQQEPSKKDETDSSAPPGILNMNSAGDAPAGKLILARKCFDVSPKDLEPIIEVPTAKSDLEENPVKTDIMQEMKEDGAKAEDGKKKKKKKLLPKRSAPCSLPEKEKDSSEVEVSSARSDSSGSKNDHSRFARPLPVPTLSLSEGLPSKRGPAIPEQKEQQETKAATDSTASQSSSVFDGVIDETPRSLPVLSARDRRREARSSVEIPVSARKVKLRRIPQKVAQEDQSKQEKISAPEVNSLNLKRQRQPSLRDSSSSEDSLTHPDENTKEREKRRENKEIDNFISLLDNTLRMNNDMDKSDEELMEVPLSPSRPLQNGQQPEGHLQRKYSEGVFKIPADPKSSQEESATPVHKSSSMPSVETLTSTSRLMNRIRLLHKDCVQGVGFSALKAASDIFNTAKEDEVEARLLEVLGDKFDEYAGKIWQLKFCEESLFTS